MTRIFSFDLKSKKGPKTSRRRLIESLDRAFSIAVRKRDGQCLRCGKKTPVYTHHIMSRRYLGTRWDMENGVTLCVSHHRRAHGDPEEFRDWVLAWMGRERFDFLKYRALRITKYSEGDLKLLREGFK